MLKQKIAVRLWHCKEGLWVRRATDLTAGFWLGSWQARRFSALRLVFLELGSG